VIVLEPPVILVVAKARDPRYQVSGASFNNHLRAIVPCDVWSDGSGGIRGPAGTKTSTDRVRFFSDGVFRRAHQPFGFSDLQSPSTTPDTFSARCSPLCGQQGLELRGQATCSSQSCGVNHHHLFGYADVGTGPRLVWFNFARAHFFAVGNR